MNRKKKSKRALIIIPARLQSSRLKEKLLIKVKGKTILQWTYENGAKVPDTDIIVATDSEKIASVVKSFGGKAALTPKNISSGTERVLYIAGKVDYPIYINLQADEPMLAPKDIEKTISLIEEGGVVSSLCFRNNNYSEFVDINNVKVVLDNQGKALYFSRSPIPFQTKENFTFFYHHVGIYGFDSIFFKRSYPNLVSNLYSIENLEQLKILENGFSIILEVIEKESVGIDTKDDLEKFNKLLEVRNG